LSTTDGTCNDAVAGQYQQWRRNAQQSANDKRATACTNEKRAIEWCKRTNATTGRRAQVRDDAIADGQVNVRSRKKDASKDRERERDNGGERK